MSGTPADDHDLAHLLGELEGDNANDDVEALPEGLREVRERICQDLEARQGSFRQSGPWARSWPIALAAVAGAGFTLALSPASLSLPLAAACALAGAAGAVALASILVCPSKPGRGERWAALSIALGLCGLGLQAYGGLLAEGPGLLRSLPGALRCGGVFVAGAVVPLLALAWMLKRSGLPVRRLHAAALGLAAFSLSALGVWRHCAPADSWHVVIAHLVLPVLATGVVAAGLYLWLSRRRAALVA